MRLWLLLVKKKGNDDDIVVKYRCSVNMMNTPLLKLNLNMNLNRNMMNNEHALVKSELKVGLKQEYDGHAFVKNVL